MTDTKDRSSDETTTADISPNDLREGYSPSEDTGYSPGDDADPLPTAPEGGTAQVTPEDNSGDNDTADGGDASDT